MRAPLPVHGFVLAGGRSTRMGRDKALLPFRGRPMVEIAVEKLRSVCAEVAMVGNRKDLAGYAPVVPESRLEAGPVAGIEAGVSACTQPWALFVPVDVPWVPGALLQAWAEELLAHHAEGVSFLVAAGERQPAFCAVHRDFGAVLGEVIEAGERSIARALYGVADKGGCALWPAGVERLMPEAAAAEVERWFSNVNTPSELAVAEAWAE